MMVQTVVAVLGSLCVVLGIVALALRIAAKARGIFALYVAQSDGALQSLAARRGLLFAAGPIDRFGGQGFGAASGTLGVLGVKVSVESDGDGGHRSFLRLTAHSGRHFAVDLSDPTLRTALGALDPKELAVDVHSLTLRPRGKRITTWGGLSFLLVTDVSTLQSLLDALLAVGNALLKEDA